jgi:hypothetical protein
LDARLLTQILSLPSLDVGALQRCKHGIDLAGEIGKLIVPDCRHPSGEITTRSNPPDARAQAG